MSLLILTLLILLPLLGAGPPAAASLITYVWYKTLVTQNQLTAATKFESYKVFDEISCTTLANNLPWCHLFTHEGNICILYDVVLDNLAANPPDATAKPCRIRHTNGKMSTAAATLLLLSFDAPLVSTHRYMYTISCFHSAPRLPHTSLTQQYLPRGGCAAASRRHW